MSIKAHFRAILIALAAAPIATIGLTAARSAEPVSFRDVEHSASGADVLSADQRLADRIAPRGVTVASASVSLRHAGARYVGKDSDGNFRFVYEGTEAVENVLHDVVVTIVLSQQSGAILSASVTRVSLGS